MTYEFDGISVGDHVTEIGDVVHVLENTDLNTICAFRMAARDIRQGRLASAAHRIRSDMDKVTDDARRSVLRAFCAEHETKVFSAQSND